MKKHLLLLSSLILLPFFLFAQESKGIDQIIDEAFKPISDFFSEVIFFTIADVPFVLVLLVVSALIFTIYFGFINIRGFGTAINVVRGKYDDIEKHEGAFSEAAVDGDIRDTIRDESVDGEV